MTKERLAERNDTGVDMNADDVRRALAEVPYPGLRRDLASFGMVKHVSVCGAQVRVQLALRSIDESVPDRLRFSVTEKLRSIGASVVTVDIVKPESIERALPVAETHRARPGVPDPWAERVRLASVKHVVAVGAGKGGVGKSTVAVNLALALARGGLAVGILDADIYGPSVPILLGIEDGSRRVRMTPEKHIVPLEVLGISLISFGFFLGEGSPVVWRGPMVSKAVKQFARGVSWPALDVLVVDLPPGTGDVPLSLVQAVELSGAIVVTQPPRLASVEARKAGEMYKKLDVPVIGVIENMTGAFGGGGGATVAAALSVPLLGSIPFDTEVVHEGDAGTPTLRARGRSKFSVAFNSIARQVAEALGWRDDHPDAAP